MHSSRYSQETIILHDPAFLSNPASRHGGGLPKYDVKGFTEHHKYASPQPDPFHTQKSVECRHNPLRFRYPTAFELKQGLMGGVCNATDVIK